MNTEILLKLYDEFATAGAEIVTRNIEEIIPILPPIMLDVAAKAQRGDEYSQKVLAFLVMQILIDVAKEMQDARN